MVYAADNPALAALEVRVHLDLPFDLLPDDYRLLAIDCPDDAVETVDAVPADTAEYGTAWLRSGRSAALRVPSLLVPECRNVLVNPAQVSAARIEIAGARAFHFDPRLWLGAGA